MASKFVGFDLRIALAKLYSAPVPQRLPGMKFPGKISVLTTMQEVGEAVKCFEGDEFLGFDTETRPQFQAGRPQNPVCLLQLANESHAILVRLNTMGWQMPPEIASILEGRHVTKIGVGISNDAVPLKTTYGTTMSRTIDLVSLARSLELPKQNLKFLVAKFLGLGLSKAQQTSNWEAPTLTGAQVYYAACDAWASRAVYLEMARQQQNLERWLDNNPPAREQAEITKQQKRFQRAVAALEAVCHLNPKLRCGTGNPVQREGGYNCTATLVDQRGGSPRTFVCDGVGETAQIARENALAALHAEAARAKVVDRRTLFAAENETCGLSAAEFADFAECVTASKI